MTLLERQQDPVNALKHILESYDYLEYDEENSESPEKLRVKVTCLEAERDIAVASHIRSELDRVTGRYYVEIINPVSGSPSQEIRDKKWTYFTLHEKDRPRRADSE